VGNHPRNNFYHETGKRSDRRYKIKGKKAQKKKPLLFFFFFFEEVVMGSEDICGEIS